MQHKHCLAAAGKVNSRHHFIEERLLIISKTINVFENIDFLIFIINIMLVLLFLTTTRISNTSLKQTVFRVIWKHKNRILLF